MRRLTAILILVFLSDSLGSAADGPVILQESMLLQDLIDGFTVAFPFDDLPEGVRQGGLLGVSGLPNPSVGGGAGYFTIPPTTFLTADPARIHWVWFDAGDRVVLQFDFYICGSAATCPRPQAKFRIKTKSAVMGVRG
jgi:hypothetical protein